MKFTKTLKQELSTRFRKIRKISVSLVVLQIFAVLWVSPESFGQMPISGALLTLDVEERSLGLHEPVHVTVGITNVTGEEISFELNEGSKYYLTFSFSTNPSFEPSNFFNLGGTNRNFSPSFLIN